MTADNSAAEGYDDQPGQTDQGSDQADDQPDNQEPPPWPGAPYAAPPSQPSPQPTSENETGVTLIFKDGRSPELIQNYVVTQGTLYVGDRYHRQIPLDQLDLPATVQVNRELGADFRLPNGTR
jgi:hypothetical protein